MRFYFFSFQPTTTPQFLISLWRRLTIILPQEEMPWRFYLGLHRMSSVQRAFICFTSLLERNPCVEFDTRVVPVLRLMHLLLLSIATICIITVMTIDNTLPLVPNLAQGVTYTTHCASYAVCNEFFYRGRRTREVGFSG